ncbi:MAG: hypothetical protein D6767_09025 [Candidatus Hydrogenedentota bacterium]|nr:MAG: hypothetical protein D6767_09025 [Candidatus Hydrogenedentota bacterium]
MVLKKLKIYTFIVVMCFTPFMLMAENTVGLRGYYGSFITIGKVGSRPFYGAPLFVGKSTEWGMQVFSSFALTPEIHIEPSFGFVRQDFLLKYEGIITNKNGVKEADDTIYDHWLKDYVTIGLAFKGKSADIKRRFRFIAIVGFEILRAAKFSIGGCGDLALCPLQATFSQGSAIARSQYEGKNQLKGGEIQEVSQTTERNVDLPSNFNPWGFRLFYGMGLEFFHPKLKGVVFELNLLAGNDLTNTLFQNTTINDSDLKESRFDFFGRVSLAAAYRIPEAKGVRGVTKQKRVKRSELDEEEEDE